jgi:CcmD family protein
MKNMLLNQITKSAEQPDLFSADKYNVVVMVIAILFIGLFGYLFSLDKKLSKIEQKEENKA